MKNGNIDIKQSKILLLIEIAKKIVLLTTVIIYTKN